MIYLIGLLPGAIAGAVVWKYISDIMKQDDAGPKYGKFSTGEKKVYPIILFLVSTFLYVPFLSLSYSWKYAREGADALWNHGLFITILVLPYIGVGLWQNRKGINYTKSQIIYAFIFVFVIGWFLPMFYNWVMG
ncbi:hypothetical protein ACFL40_02035 [candidate division KSB1 bacterium]